MTAPSIYLNRSMVMAEDPYKTRMTLIQRVKDPHDGRSWEEFIGIYKGYIYAVLHNMRIAESDHDELVQETLIKLWKNLPKLNDEHKGRFRNWLSTITKNCVIDFIRKRNREAALLEKAAAEKEIDYLNSIPLKQINEASETAWKQHLTNMALDNIEGFFSGKAIQVFRLSIQGKDTEEIAEELQIKSESVYRLRTRVKARLIEEVARLRADTE